MSFSAKIIVSSKIDGLSLFLSTAIIEHFGQLGTNFVPYDLSGNEWKNYFCRSVIGVQLEQTYVTSRRKD